MITSSLLFPSESPPSQSESRPLPPLRAPPSSRESLPAQSELRPPRFLMALAVSAALALPTVAVPRPRARRIVAGVTIAVLSFLALADALYFRFFGGIKS